MVQSGFNNIGYDFKSLAMTSSRSVVFLGQFHKLPKMRESFFVYSVIYWVPISSNILIGGIEESADKAYPRKSELNLRLNYYP